MFFLNATTETLELVTSATADIDYQINYVDVIPAVSATPGHRPSEASRQRQLQGMLDRFA